MPGKKTTDKRRTRFGLELEQSAREILAHVKGETELPTRRIVLPEEVDVKRIRSEAGMSQAEFARAFCINPITSFMPSYQPIEIVNILPHAEVFPNHRALAEAVRATATPGDVLLVKGSRGMRMEGVIEALRATPT